jgi:hypothetical protein
LGKWKSILIEYIREDPGGKINKAGFHTMKEMRLNYSIIGLPNGIFQI